MIINRLLKIALVILSIIFVFLKIFKFGFYADLSSAALLIMFTALYVRQTNALKKRNPFFLLFLVCFALSEIVAFFSNFILLDYEDTDYIYYISNILYMLAYTFLILRCVISMNLSDILKKFPVTLAILIALSVFCVTLITETAQTQLNTSEYITELLFNVVVMTLLSVSLIGYMSKSDNKSMLFFIGCMFIFFSEMLQLAYYYIDELVHLAASYSLFIVLAFVFFYQQSKLKHEKQPDFSFLDSTP